MKRWVIRVLVVAIVLVAGGYFFAKSYITKDFIVEKVEKAINSRVQIEDLSVGFNGLSASIELKNVLVAKRDNLASEKVPHSDREKIENGELSIETAKFNVSIWDAFSKEILVKKINIDGVIIDCTLDENGDVSIEELFAKPDKKKKKKKKKFNAQDNKKFITKINEVHLTNVDVNLVIKKTQLSVKGRGVNLHMLNINVNPKKLDSVNDAKITLDGVFDLMSLKNDTDYGKIIPIGEAEVTLFNSENGDLEPDMVLALTLDSESYITSDIPVMKGVWKAIEQINKLGINILNIPNKAKFQNDQSVKVAYKLSKSTLLQPLSIKVKDWELELLENSWIKTGDEQHHIGVKFHISKALSGTLSGLLGESSLGGLLSDLTEGSALLEEGRLALHLESSGLLSKPKIALKNDFSVAPMDLIDGFFQEKDNLKENVEKKLKEKGKDFLKGLLE